MMKTLLNIIGLVLIAGVISVNAQTAPTATNVKVLGSAYYNTSTSDATTLTGYYDFEDADNDTEGTSTYKWYRDLNGNGPEAGEEIAGATNIRYTVQAADAGYDLYFEVTPVDNSPQPGTTVASATGSTVSSTTSYDDYALGNNETFSTGSPWTALTYWLNGSTTNNSDGITVAGGTTLNIYGDLDLTNVNSSFTITVQGDMYIYGKLITKNNIDINVQGGSILEIFSGLEGKNGSDISVIGELSVTGNVALESNATIYVNGGADLNVDGNLDIGDNASVDVVGDMAVSGDLDTGSGSTIDINWGASVDVGGDLDGNAEITGNGPITVGGDVSGGIDDTDGNQLQTLPVELTSFKASLFRDKAILHWVTASEENNEYFSVERSTDGVNFETIATKNGAGTTTEKTNYSYIDKAPKYGINYYRLKQNDFDGKFSYSSIVTVENFNATSLEIGPNPASSYLNIVSPEAMNGNLKIISHNGAVLLNENISGTHQTVDVSNIKAGQYLVVYKTDKGMISKKIIIN